MINRNQLSVRTGLARDLGSRGAVELAYRGEMVAFPGAGMPIEILSHYGEGLSATAGLPWWRARCARRTVRSAASFPRITTR